MEIEQATKKGKTNPGDSTKRKMVSFSECILKKKHPEVKHCVLFTPTTVTTCQTVASTRRTVL